MPEMRIAGHRGRRPVKPPAERFPIQYLSSYLRAPLPAPAYPVDVSAGITDWGMLGNGPDKTCTTHPNGVGDCTFAGRQHYKMAKAAAGGETEQWESSDQLVAEYLTYDKGQDQGANIADLLLYWYKAGAILAFAPVDHTIPAAVDAAMAAFHGAYVGVNLTDDADSLFGQGQPWTTAGGQQPDPNEGHCIVKVRPTAVSSIAGLPGERCKGPPSRGPRRAWTRPGSSSRRKTPPLPISTSRPCGRTSTPCTAPVAASSAAGGRCLRLMCTWPVPRSRGSATTNSVVAPAPPRAPADWPVAWVPGGPARPPAWRTER